MENALLLSIRTVVFLVVLTPLVVTNQTLFPFVVGKALYARALIEIAVGLWLVLALMYPAYRPPRSWVLAAFGLYLVVALLAGVFGVSLQRSLWSTYERMQGLVDLAHWVAFALVLTSTIRTLPDWRTLLNFNLGVSLVMGLLGIAQQLESWNFPFYEFLRETSRLDITLGNPTYVAAYMLVNVMVALGFLAQSFQGAPPPERSVAVRRRRRRRGADPRNYSLTGQRIFWTVTLGLDMWVIWATATRGAFVGLAVGLIAVAVGYILWGQAKPWRVAAVSVISVIVGLAALFAVAKGSGVLASAAESSFTVERFTTIGTGDPSIKARLASQAAGLKGFQARPVLGWGPENYIVPFGRYFSADSGVTEISDQAHNKLLQELTTKGAVGFLAYVALWALMFRVVVRRIRLRNPNEQVLLLFIAGAMTGYFVQNLFLFDTPATMLQFVLLLAFAANAGATLDSSPAMAGRRPQAGHGNRNSPVSSLPGRLGALIAKLQKLARRWTGSRLLNRVRSVWPAQAHRSLYGRIVTFSVMLSLSLWLAYSLNYRPFVAATEVAAAQSETTWADAIERLERSIDGFSPLANYPRLSLFSAAKTKWDSLTEEERTAALLLAEEEAQHAFSAEPQAWRLHAALGDLYLTASVGDPTLVDRANFYVAKAIELAPETSVVLRLKEKQQDTLESFKK